MFFLVGDDYEKKGNKNCHVILRGGATGPNYQAEKIAPVLQALAKENLTPTVMVDCSHGNSEKQHLKQISVAENIVSLLTNPGEKY